MKLQGLATTAMAITIVLLVAVNIQQARRLTKADRDFWKAVTRFEELLTHFNTLHKAFESCSCESVPSGS